MATFSSREIAATFWLLVFAVVVLQKSEVRKSAIGVLLAFCQRAVFTTVVLMILYLVCVIWGLHVVGLWTMAELKDSVLWFFGGAMAILLRFVNLSSSKNNLYEIVKDNIKVVVVVEFLVNVYTFPLAVELVLVPFLTVVTMVSVVAGMDRKHALVEKFTKRTLCVAGSLILVIALARAVVDYNNLSSLNTLRSFLLAPILSVLLFPFVYFVLLDAQYELVFIRLNSGANKTPHLIRYAKKQIFMFARFSLKRVQCILQNYIVDIMNVRRESDVDELLKRARVKCSSHAREAIGGEEPNSKSDYCSADVPPSTESTAMKYE